jgi:5-(carboxyamino)imidazole ribonucleotide mutase
MGADLSGDSGRVKRLDHERTGCYPPRMPSKPLVGIIMGSKTDLDVLQGAVEVLGEFGVEHELRILSAHRTPERVLEWAQTAEERGLEVLIAGAGSAAALPGVVAAKTLLPVLGVPVASTTLGGVDALLSIVQMPKGVPVGTLAIGKGGAANAALLAVSILAAKRPELREKLRAWRKKRADEVLKSDQEAQEK